MLQTFSYSFGRTELKWLAFLLFLCLCGSGASNAQEQQRLMPDAPKAQTGIIVGTVVDINDDAVPAATVTLQGPLLKSPRTAVADGNGFFEYSDLEAGSLYRITISAQGFATWTSPDITLKPGQYLILTDTRLRIATALTTVAVGYSSEEIATQQIKVEEQQRIFGILPNFLVVYDPNPAPLTTKLKFKLASKVAFDPVTFIGVGLVAASNQGGGTPDYRGGTIGFAERYGAAYTNGFSDIMIGGAILPSLLHQDTRYFYQGTGTTKSRVFHAIASPFVCRGDNGLRQPNYSTMGGDLGAAALANAYYPPSNRGVGLFLSTFLIDTGQRAAANLAQEFILRRLTSKARSQK